MSWKLLQEYYGFAGRLDFSGRRGGVNYAPQERPDNFPYDEEPSYGTPQQWGGRAQGRDGADGGGQAPVPKDVEHTAWDPEGDDPKTEAAGLPLMIGKADDQSTGAVIPGTSKGWADAPFDNEVPDDELTTAALHAKPDDKNVLSIATGGRYQMGNSRIRRNNRQESWQRLAEAYVSLKDTPEGQMKLSRGIEEAELEALKAEFKEVSDRAHGAIDEMDDTEALKFVFTIDPDHAAQSLSSVGKDKISDTYKSWADRVLGMPDGDEQKD